MKFGINTFLWTASFGPADFGLLPRIKAHGLDGVEATPIRPQDFAASAIHQALLENELQCTICSVLPAELSLIAEDATTRKKTVAHFRVRETNSRGRGQPNRWAALLSGRFYPGAPPDQQRVAMGDRGLSATRTSLRQLLCRPLH